jgi:EmrB/QacA subfamily drug resistance transporter
MKRETKILAIVSAGTAMGGLDLSLMFVAYPAIRADFPKESVTLISWVLTSFTIVAAALLIPAGRLADKWGRKRIFRASLLVFAAGSVACALAPNVPLLIAGRVVAAIGGAMLTPSGLALLMSAVPPERRSYAVGVWGTITGTLATAAPTLGAAAIKYGSWRWALIMPVPLGLVAWAVSGRVLEESVDPNAGPMPDPVGALLIAAGVASAAFGIVQSGRWGWTDQGTLVAVGTGVALLCLLVWRCAHHPYPIVDLRVFKPFLFKATALASICIGIAFWGAYYLFVQFLTLGWGYTIMTAGLLLIPMTLTSSFFGIWSGRTMDRHGHRVVMVPAALLFSAGMAWLALHIGDHRQLGLVWIPAALAVGGTNAAFFTGVNGAGSKTAPAEVLGLTAGIIQTLIRIGGALGTALGISIVGEFHKGDPVHDLRPAFWAFALVGVAAAITAIPLATGPVRARVRARQAVAAP